MRCNSLKNTRVYRKEDEPVSIKIGQIRCTECGSVADHIERKGKGFITWFSKCPNCNQNIQLDKKIYDFFQIGDRIKLYETLSFGKDAKIDLSTYEEGLIVDKHKGITCYYLDMKVDKAVHQNKPVVKTSWLYGYVVKGIASDSNSLELLTPQLKMII